MIIGKTTTNGSTTRFEAEEMGKALLQKVKLANKELQVWQNLGWHYGVRGRSGRAFLTVYPTSNNGFYHCLLGYGFGGDCRWSDVSSSRDPNRCIRATLKRMEQILLEDARYMLDALRLVP